jgi:hypothetical protein
MSMARETKADVDIAHVLTMDKARRIASNIAKLPAEAASVSCLNVRSTFDDLG